MNIVYASDDNYADILGVSLVSLFENNRGEALSVHILNDGIGRENIVRLRSLGEKYGQDMSFYDVTRYYKSGLDPHHLTMAAFSRLYMSSILSEDTDKALYLDCDVMIRKNLRRLWNADLTGIYAAAVSDCVSTSHRNAIGLGGSSVYFNSGVLLANLGRWRQDRLPERFERFAEKYGGSVPYEDQGILNGVMSEKTKLLPPEYNCYTVMFDFPYDDLLIYRKPSKFYSREQVMSALSDPAIVHFTASFLSVRPWVKGCAHPYAEEWLEYKAMSPWADVPLRRDNRKFYRKSAERLYRLVPGKISLRTAGFLHARLKPFTQKQPAGE